MAMEQDSTGLNTANYSRFHKSTIKEQPLTVVWDIKQL